MEEILVGTKIGADEMVGVIYEKDGIYYPVFGLGKKRDHGGYEVKAFKGGAEVEPEVEKIVEKLNNGSSAYQRLKKELKEENKSPLKRVRRPLTTKEERKKIKRMARDPHIYDLFEQEV